MDDDKIDDEAEQMWRIEFARRVQELDAGTVETIPWDQARLQLRSRLHLAATRALTDTAGLT